MEKSKRKSLGLLTVIGFIINLISILVILFVSTKNDEKGINSLIISLSLFSLCSFFPQVAKQQYFSNNKLSKYLFILGAVYVLVISIVIYKSYLDDEGFLVVLTLYILLFTPFIISLIHFANQKVVRTSTHVLIVISWILSIPSLLAFIFTITNIVQAIFNKEVPFPWQL